jgi:mannose-6-phosphate isomerase-like protein (cupin superfamily)
MSSPETVERNEMVFRRTNARVGRHIPVSPATSAMRHLAYGRIILNSSKPAESFVTRDRETGFIVLSGEATVNVGDSKTLLEKYDAIYIPRDSSVQVATTSHVDIAEFSADVENRYPLQVVRFATISKDPGLKFGTGGPDSHFLKPATGRVGLLTNTPRCWRSCTSISTCLTRHLEFSWFTTTRSNRNWSPSCAMVMPC